MENTKGISRARFLAGAAAAGLAGAAALPAGQAVAAPGKRRGLKRRGVVYTVGAGETPGTAWSAARMRRDVRLIRDDLHADTLDVTGDGVDRLTATAAEAAERGLTKPIRKHPTDPNSKWHWEPKEAYRALSHRYAQHP